MPTVQTHTVEVFGETIDVIYTKNLRFHKTTAMQPEYQISVFFLPKSGRLDTFPIFKDTQDSATL